MTLQELINRDFNGNISAFAKAYDTTRATTYRLLKGLSKPQEKLRNRLLRKGVRCELSESAKIAIIAKRLHLTSDLVKALYLCEEHRGCVNVEDIINDYKNDYLTLNTGLNDVEYAWYFDDIKNIAVAIKDLTVYEGSEVDKLGLY